MPRSQGFFCIHIRFDTVQIQIQYNRYCTSFDTVSCKLKRGQVVKDLNSTSLTATF